MTKEETQGTQQFILELNNLIKLNRQNFKENNYLYFNRRHN